jgi:hypothetical protein
MSIAYKARATQRAPRPRANVLRGRGYTDDSASQIAKEQDTKLEILKHPAAYYRVEVD